MCSACMTIWPSASNSAQEASRRSLMLAECGGLDEHGAHLLAGGAQGAGDDPQRDRVDAHRFSSRIVPDSSTSPAQPGGTASVASGSSTSAGPSISVAGLRLAGEHGRLVLLAAEDARRGCERSAPAAAAPAAAASTSGPGLGGGGAQRDELDLALGVAVAVGLLVGGVEGLAQLVGVVVRLDGELERLAAVAQLGRHAHVGVVVAELLARPLGELAGLARERLVGQLVAGQQHAALDVAAALGDDEPERRQHARRARAQDPRHAELLGDVGGVQAARAAEAQQRQLARVDAALDGHHPQRADHLGVGDAADALGALVQLEVERVGRASSTARLGRLAVELDLAAERRARRRAGRAAGWRR